jgi:hypothetical protein
MRDLLVSFETILPSTRFEAVDQLLDNRGGVQEVRKRSQGAGSIGRAGAGQIRPSRRDQALRAVREDEAQLGAPVPRYPAQHRQFLAVERVMWSHDAHGRREVPDVGSVSPTLSTPFHTPSCSRR